MKAQSSFCMGTGGTWPKKQSSGWPALSALFSHEAPFLNSWGQTVSGWVMQGAVVGRAAGMAESGRGREGIIQGPKGTTSFLQINISTMSDRSWTRDEATESGERQDHRYMP